ncbi:hypothetical protein SB30_280035 [Klebsiella quasipneumoniae subsp. similipneumoniae]|nr:hypothetical protein SB30_280035 [Klebsiella quasipneumoniae subsp. similipneumoniae]
MMGFSLYRHYLHHATQMLRDSIIIVNFWIILRYGSLCRARKSSFKYAYHLEHFVINPLFQQQL